MGHLGNLTSSGELAFMRPLWPAAYSRATGGIQIARWGNMTILCNQSTYQGFQWAASEAGWAATQREEK